MKKKISSRILVVFILNVIFTMFELLGGFLSRSSAIMTHAVVDLVETFALGISYLCEKIGVKKANKTFTFGYSRFIILGAFVTTLFLIYGCTFMLYIGVTKIFDPHEVGHLEMIIVAIFGIIVNVISTYTTRSKADINEESVYVNPYNSIISWVLFLS